MKKTWKGLGWNVRVVKERDAYKIYSGKPSPKKKLIKKTVVPSKSYPFKKPKVKLTGGDGNAFVIIGKVSNALAKAGLRDQVPKFQKEAMSGDYDNVLRTAARYADIS